MVRQKSSNAVLQEEQASLRARKKQRTREQIADAAARLFAAKGFDLTTIAEIARAAEVSEQTVYNYFPTKEELVFDEDAAFAARLIRMVRERPPGTRLINAARSEAHAFLEELGRRPDGPQRTGGMPYLVAVSPALRRHWLERVERYTHIVANVLVEQSAETLSMPTAKVLAFSLTAVFTVIIDEFGQAMKTGKANRRAVLNALRTQVDAAFDRIAAGL